MADVYAHLRFYGRFFYLVPGTPGPITILAPNFNHVRFGPHRTQMSVRRDRIVWMDDQTNDLVTTLQPTGKALSDAPDVTEAEILEWDLSGLTVDYNGWGSEVKIVQGDGETNAAILNLHNLEVLAGNSPPALDPRAYDPDPRGKTNAVFNVLSGVGTASAVDPRVSSYTFITEDDAGTPLDDTALSNKAVREQGTVVKKMVADVVEFKVLLDPGAPRLTLRFTGPSGEAGRVTVEQDTRVNFSNLCTRFATPVRPDLEFSQYYDLLNSPRAVERGLIPVEPQPAGGTLLGEGEDCECPAMVIS